MKMKSTLLTLSIVFFAVNTAKADSHVGLGAGSVFGGEVITGFTGSGGHNNVWQNGGANSSVNIDGTGSLCGFGCQDGSTSAYAGANNGIAFEGEAGGEKASDLVSSANQTEAGASAAINNGRAGFSIAGAATGKGETAGVFAGDTGNVFTTQSGENGVATEMWYNSDLCPDSRCKSGKSGKIGFSGFSWQTNGVSAFASGNNPGQMVGTSTEGSTQSFVGFDFMKKKNNK